MQNMEFIIKLILTILAILPLNFQVNSQDKTEDWKIRSINNVEFQKSKILSSRSILLVFGTTWCEPTWELVYNGKLDSLHNKFGTDGTNQLQLIFIESDPRTNVDHLKGIDSDEVYTMGDWITDHEYPICNEESLVQIYNVRTLPTAVLIKADQDPIYLTGGSRISEKNIVTSLANSSALTLSPFDDVTTCETNDFFRSVSNIAESLDNNSEKFASAADDLEKYFKTELGVDGSWDHSIDSSNSDIFIKCISDSDCKKLTVMSKYTDKKIFKVENGNKESIKDKSVKSQVTKSFFILNSIGPKLEIMITDYKNGTETGSAKFSQQAYCNGYSKRIKKKTGVTELVKAAEDVEKLCSQPQFQPLFE